MITLKKSSNAALTVRPAPVGSDPLKSKTIGSSSLNRRQARSRDKDSGFTSESTSSPVSSMGPNVGISNNPITLDLEPMLTGITPQIEQSYFYRLYRDIYYQDPVAGSAVDLISTLPFSEFTLGGVEDAKVLSTFMETLERLNLKTLLPEISVDYLVLGSHTSSLLFNKEKKIFTNIMPHAVENLKIENLPFFSQDPIITVKFTAAIQDILKRDSPRIKRIRESLGATVVEKILGGELELDPLSTIYIPRKTFSTSEMGTSYYRRILPIYLIEKNLFRGTLVESARRQRGILHLMVGDGDQWEPSVADLEFLTDLFMNADSDPLGAIIATRMGVSVEELRQGGDFWKVTDFSDSVLPHKLRALGISEGFLSGDQNYNSADQSMTVFIEVLRSYREMLTRKLFYNKLFPLISMLNGFTINTKGKIVVKDGLLNEANTEDALFRLNDGSKLCVPTISWSKQLKPEGDSAYMEVLGQMADKGIPVPLRVLAASGGLNLDEILKQQDEDLAIRRRLAEYSKKLEEFAPKAPDAGGEDEGTAEASAIRQVLAREGILSPTRSAVQASGGKMSIMNRNFGETGEVTGFTKTGKKKYIHDQKKANERINFRILKAMKSANSSGKFNTPPVSIKGSSKSKI